jgi:hypothetical protein
MASRDLWSKKGTLHARDLLASLLGSVLLGRSMRKPLYICSAYLSDFPLFDNAFGQFQSLFRTYREIGEKTDILFSEALAEFSSFAPVRIVATPTDTAAAFLRRVISQERPQIAGRMATNLYHEKGMLCEAFYIEGSMNFTYNGVYRRDEKITAHTPDDPAARGKLTAATLEMERLWANRLFHEVHP